MIKKIDNCFILSVYPCVPLSFVFLFSYFKRESSSFYFGMCECVSFVLFKKRTKKLLLLLLFLTLEFQPVVTISIIHCVYMHMSNLLACVRAKKKLLKNLYNFYHDREIVFQFSSLFLNVGFSGQQRHLNIFLFVAVAVYAFFWMPQDILIDLKLTKNPAFFSIFVRSVESLFQP